MNTSFRRDTFYIALVFIAASLISACENPGSVGEDLTDSQSEIGVDTVNISGIKVSEYNSYSGAFAFFSAGVFNDPIFGTMNAVGMLKPSLPNSRDTVFKGASMKLRLIINQAQVYGDSLTAQHFNVFEINQLWRGKAWKLKDDISYSTADTIASFTVGNSQDSVDVDLKSNWVDRYRGYAQSTSDNVQSDYEKNFLGLALVPADSNKILPFSSTSSRFVIENAAADTFAVPLRQWAYNLNRSAPTDSLPAGTKPLFNTYEKVLHFKTDFSNVEVQSLDISKAELVLHRNEEILRTSLTSKSPNTSRPAITNARLHLVDPQQTPENIDPGNPIANGIFSSADSAFHFNITAQLQSFLSNGVNENSEFYITLPNNGIVKNDAIYTDSKKAPGQKKPELIITFLKNSNN